MTLDEWEEATDVDQVEARDTLPAGPPSEYDEGCDLEKALTPCPACPQCQLPLCGECFNCYSCGADHDIACRLWRAP